MLMIDSSKFNSIGKKTTIIMHKRTRSTSRLKVRKLVLVRYGCHELLCARYRLQYCTRLYAITSFRKCLRSEQTSTVPVSYRIYNCSRQLPKCFLWSRHCMNARVSRRNWSGESLQRNTKTARTALNKLQRCANSCGRN